MDVLKAPTWAEGGLRLDDRGVDGQCDFGAAAALHRELEFLQDEFSAGRLQRVLRMG